MKPLSSVGIGLSLVSGCLFLALVAEVYYLFWWKKRRINRDIEEVSYGIPAKEFLHLFCWKKPSSMSSTALNPGNGAAHSDGDGDGYGQLHLHSNPSKDMLLEPFGAEDMTMEAELMRLHSLAGPPRFLFTIEEETKEDLESEDGRKGPRGKSLSDLFLSETPFLTPLSSPRFFTPPLTPLDRYKQNGINPLFECSKDEDLSKMWTSPPPKLKFLRDAEEKLYRKTLKEEATRVNRNGGFVEDMARKVVSVPSQPSPMEEDGSFITIVIGKNRDRGHHHSTPSQVIPLPPSPLSSKNGKV